MKRGAQDIADAPRGYGLGRSPRQTAAEARAAALNAEIEAVPGPEAAKFDAANRRYQVAKTIEEPAVTEATRMRGLPLATRSSEMLFGRGFTQNPSVLGAIGGVVTGNILDSRLFHTASAAVKRQVIDALQSGQPQLAADILFRTAIAGTQARRAAERELAAQGEGVIAP
jgi:hypothetical protein